MHVGCECRWAGGHPTDAECTALGGFGSAALHLVCACWLHRSQGCSCCTGSASHDTHRGLSTFPAEFGCWLIINVSTPSFAQLKENLIVCCITLCFLQCVIHCAAQVDRSDMQASTPVCLILMVTQRIMPNTSCIHINTHKHIL